jgi:hypothetical protein
MENETPLVEGNPSEESTLVLLSRNVRRLSIEDLLRLKNSALLSCPPNGKNVYLKQEKPQAAVVTIWKFNAKLKVK